MSCGSGNLGNEVERFGALQNWRGAAGYQLSWKVIQGQRVRVERSPPAGAAGSHRRGLRKNSEYQWQARPWGRQGCGLHGERGGQGRRLRRWGVSTGVTVPASGRGRGSMFRVIGTAGQNQLGRRHTTEKAFSKGRPSPSVHRRTEWFICRLYPLYARKTTTKL